jgi:hypothetical protein
VVVRFADIGGIIDQHFEISFHRLFILHLFFKR